MDDVYCQLSTVTVNKTKTKITERSTLRRQLREYLRNFPYTGKKKRDVAQRPTPTVPQNKKRSVKIREKILDITVTAAFPVKLRTYFYSEKTRKKKRRATPPRVPSQLSHRPSLKAARERPRFAQIVQRGRARREISYLRAQSPRACRKGLFGAYLGRGVASVPTNPRHSPRAGEKDSVELGAYRKKRQQMEHRFLSHPPTHPLSHRTSQTAPRRANYASSCPHTPPVGAAPDNPKESY